MMAHTSNPLRTGGMKIRNSKSSLTTKQVGVMAKSSSGKALTTKTNNRSRREPAHKSFPPTFVHLGTGTQTHIHNNKKCLKTNWRPA